MDLETTGSDPEKDNIIEVGAILTTHDLTVLGSTAVVVTPSDLSLGRMMRNDVVRQMHEDNGLLARVLEGWTLSVHDAARHLDFWLEVLDAEEGKVVLAGSGVGHFDRKFLDRYMPQFTRKWLRYWCIDVGVIRRASEMWGAPTPERNHNDDKTHRALDDAWCHLREAADYAELWRGA